MNRREFLLLAAAATAVAGCQAVDARSGGAPSAMGGEREIDAGPAERFAADGVYSDFLEQGFFVIRKGEKLVALSSICTHRHCKLQAEPDRSFYCDCHGSTFDSAGKVTEGPAKRDLPVLPSRVVGGRLRVKVPGSPG